MKKSILMLGSILTASVLFTGCATLFGGGSNQQINIQSKKEVVVDIYKVEPLKDKNDVESDTENKSKTIEPQLIHSNIKLPSTVNVNRDSKDILIKPITADECEELRVKKELNGWFWGDVIATSLVSTTTDAVTGAMWKYDENATVDCK